MAQDPLFTVGVVSAGPDLLSIVLSVVPSLLVALIGVGGVLLGARAQYRGTREAERQRFDEETRHLAMSIASEARAAIEMLKLMRKLTEQASPEFRYDTLVYSVMPENIMPITAAAAMRVGRFTPDVATLVPEVLILLANLRQGTMTIGAMNAANVLTEDKFNERAGRLGPIAERLIERGIDLAAAIDTNYGRANATVKS